MGSQYWGMGRGLYDSEPVFRETMNRCFAISREIGAAELYRNQRCPLVICTSKPAVAAMHSQANQSPQL